MTILSLRRLCLVVLFKGLQRVVLFTAEVRIYKLLCESEKAQLAEQEIILSLKNVGVSLVNNSSGQEVSFIGITRWISSHTYTHTHTIRTTNAPQASSDHDSVTVQNTEMCRLA